ncbi:MAG TPA: hypothetical protein EYG99_01045 [Candidatus Pacebacteria bacterium]|nr:hypothetical protein [Candidatus Paceibacterota bacterium]
MDRILYKNIIATVTYYDVLNYPLTVFEVWKHLIRSSSDDSRGVWSLEDVRYALGEKEIAQYISQKNGMYFLFGRDELIALRRKREYISFVKMRKLRRIVSILRVSPFVRAICVTGRLAYNNCDKGSDLDVLVIYKYGHIWTGRFCLTVLSHILGVRRQDDKINNRICLNCHITTKSLCVPTRDLFAAHEYTFATPLFDTNYHMQFCHENKEWIQNMKPHHKCARTKSELTVGDNIITKYIRVFFEFILADSAMEKRLKKLQLKKIQSNPKTQKQGALILCNDNNLIFLPKPQGPVVFEEYKRRFDALEINF